MTKHSKRFDLCIVGAGVVGASLAAYCKKYPELNIALIDVSFDFQDRIVGELLQPSGVSVLDDLGLSSAIENIEAQDVLGYALFSKDQHFSMPYTDNETGKQLIGKGITNGAFVQNLRALADANDNVSCISGRVKSLVYDNERVVGVSIHGAEGEEEIIEAKTVIASDGFFSKLRKGLHTIKPTVTSYFIGIELENVVLPYAQHGHIFSSEVANILCYQISNSRTRVLIDYKTETMPTKDDAFKQFLFEDIPNIMPEAIAEAFVSQVKMHDLKFMPNHYLPAKMKNRPKGLILLGDALNMRHPLTGGGMTVGLKDVLYFSACLAHFNTEDFESKVSSFYSKRTEWSATVNVMADALYQVVNNEKLRDACFNYLSYGGDNFKEPISLLAQSNTNKIDLLKHFAAVALNGTFQAPDNQDDIKGRLKHSQDIITDASKIIFPLLKNEFLRF